MIIDVRLRDLSWITRLAEVGHVTTAAALLGTTQPTLSRTVAHAEAELGTRLFVRTTTGVSPTPAGRLVVEAARELGERYARLESDLAAQLDPDSGTVRLAFLDSIASSLVPRLLGDFHRHAPGVKVLLRQEPGHEMLADLESGAVDLAITSPRPPAGPGGGYGWHPVQEERLVLVVQARHRLAGRRRVRVAELVGEELVTTPVGFGFRSIVDTLLREAGTALRVSFESQDLATIEGLVAAGLGVAILPEQLAGVSGTVGVPIASAGARRTVGLAWRAGEPLSPPAERLRRVVAGQG